MKYRKKALVDAYEFNDVTLFDAIFKDHLILIKGDKDSFVIKTKLGNQPMNFGDFLIVNPDGEAYPCPRDTFLSTYKEVNYDPLDPNRGFESWGID